MMVMMMIINLNLNGMTKIVSHALAIVFIDLNYCAVVLQLVVSNISYTRKCQISKRYNGL
jgi:hypothetical protein